MFIYQSVFPLSFRLGSFYCSVFWFTDSFLCPHHSDVVPIYCFCVLVVIFFQFWNFLLFLLYILYFFTQTFYFFTETHSCGDESPSCLHWYCPDEDVEIHHYISVRVLFVFAGMMGGGHSFFCGIWLEKIYCLSRLTLYYSLVRKRRLFLGLFVYAPLGVSELPILQL